MSMPGDIPSVLDQLTLEEKASLLEDKNRELQANFDRLKVVTDAQGQAVIHGLPPLAGLGQINVTAPGVDPNTLHEPSAKGHVDPIKPGETGKVTIRLEK